MASSPLPPQTTASPAGLDENEVARRLSTEGYNELPRQGRRGIPRIFVDVVRDPMLAMLLCAGFIYMILGDKQEAMILVAFAGLSILITVVQETRTERALEALRELTSPRALVIRDGIRKRIAGREVVRGDVVVLVEGDRVPADGWLVENDGLHLDESLLTGESVAVRKRVMAPGETPSAVRPGGDDLPYVYSGSLVIRGQGICIVSTTGPATEMGRIGQVLSTVETEVPRLQRQTRRLVIGFAVVGLAASIAAGLLYGLFRGSWLEAALTGIALGMSLLPEEFPVVLTIFMAMGAMRLSRQRVLTRRATAIETLGAATVLCTDKTGTLTQNRMRIAELRLPDRRILKPDEGTGGMLENEFHLLAEFGILASAQQATDPMDMAFHELGAGLAHKEDRPGQSTGWSMVHHYPLGPDLLAMTHVWSHDPEGTEHIVATKGAPEAIAVLCRMTGEEKAALGQTVDDMADKGLRVIGVADALWSGTELPSSQRDFAFTFRGLVGLADPLRPSVPDAVRQCREAGIRILMITGDYPQTARAIARQAGIDATDCLTGDALSSMDEAELPQRIGTVSVFARIMPEQKLRLVEALKAAGEIVAMTGDGVNDAPSLKVADIGIAMGGRGTDVAREAASIVLLDDDFGSIVNSIRMGRRIYDNLRKAMGFIVAVHIPIAGLALLPLLTGMPLLIGPVHIAMLEMIIDPVCSLAFEAETEEHDIMQRPPRPPESPLFSRWLLGWSVIQGSIILLVVGGTTLFLWMEGSPAGQLRSVAFLTLVAGVLSLILANRRFSTSLSSAVGKTNRVLALVVVLVAVIILVTQVVSPVADLFAFAPASPGQLLFIAFAGIGTLVVIERLKALWTRRLQQ
ncbi:MAG: cation-translocating P-type ATPase [Pseudomonadota bacterium]